MSSDNYADRMSARERFLSVMRFEPVRTLKWEFGYWAASVRRWYREGLEAKAGLDDKWSDGDGVHGGAAGWRPGRPLGKDVNEYFGLDESVQRVLMNNFLCPQFPVEVLEEHGDWLLLRNENGMIEKRFKDNSSLSAYLEGPVKTRDDWEQLKAERLRPTLEGRLPDNWEEMKTSYKGRSFPLAVAGGQGLFGTPRFLFGEVQVLMSFYDQPELIQQMVNDLVDFWIAIYDQVLDQIDVDLAFIWEDICYNNGPLISPAIFKRFILPGYKKLTGFLRGRGVENIIVDTDGDVWKLLPLFIEGGISGMYPFEVAAGMDIVAVRKAFPRLQILGGIAKSALISGQPAIDKELEAKVPWMLQQSGYIPYMDHLVPPDVSWKNFCDYRIRLNELIERSYPAWRSRPNKNKDRSNPMFYALTQENALEYIKTRPIYDSLFERAPDLKVVDLAAGNINLIFRVYSASDPDNKSVILKQALPYAWRYPDFKMPQSRAVKEWEVLLMENKYCPGLAPRVYDFDQDMYISFLEDCNRHVIMRQGLMKQVVYPRFARDIGVFLARTLFYTSNLYLPSEKVKEAVVHYSNPVMCKVTEDLVFTEPYKPHSNNHYTPALEPQVKAVYADDALYSEVLEMKETFMTHAEALSHGDLHTGSILINTDQTIVIDPEFAFYGPMSFDIGAVLGNLLLSYASQGYHAQDVEKRKAYQAWLMDTMSQIWYVFTEEFNKLWDTERNREEWPAENYRQKYIQRILQDTAGMGACKAMRRILGMAHVPDLESIPDEAARARAESLALNAAISWIKRRREITSIENMVAMVKEAKPHPSLT